MTTLTAKSALDQEVARRRTFAIISHPDAGKTTLTEKLLLYAGVIDLAGTVRTRRNQRHATSDWMALEQERGISITSTALQFDYEGCRFNLLDTPGHQDFSEDTYRTLMAVDSAVMVLDSAKGIEPQTKKLFEVCRLRRIPILTFINKLDHPGRDPFELLDEIEQVLGLATVPFNWPIGSGLSFKGIYDREQHQVHQFSRTQGGQFRAPVVVRAISDPGLDDLLGEAAARELREEVELLEGAGVAFEREAFLAGELTPVYFGSALTNFGVGPFLDALVDLAPPPGPRPAAGDLIEPTRAEFSGFVFKIQANLDPQHRDRMAFLRVCSGRFEKDMLVYHPRLGRKLRIARPHRLFARERETVEEAFPGDVVGLSNPGLFVIGDTVCTGEPVQFSAIPRFPPECFATIRNTEVAKYKQFDKGLEQLEEEGAIQVLYLEGGSRREPILGAVGELQFDVVQARLRTEYGVNTDVQRLPFALVRWVDTSSPSGSGDRLRLSSSSRLAQDRSGRTVLLFSSRWEEEYALEQNPGLTLRELG